MWWDSNLKSIESHLELEDYSCFDYKKKAIEWLLKDITSKKDFYDYDKKIWLRRIFYLPNVMGGSSKLISFSNYDVLAIYRIIMNKLEVIFSTERDWFKLFN